VNICIERDYKKQVNSIRYKSVTKDFWSYKERDGTWRIKTNDKLDELIRHTNTINHIKAQRFGYLHGLPEERRVKKYIQV
jgi:hypothetical protein